MRTAKKHGDKMFNCYATGEARDSGVERKESEGLNSGSDQEEVEETEPGRSGKGLETETKESHQIL